MKIISGSLLLFSFLALILSCNQKGTGENDTQTANDIVTIADTGYTGIKQFMSGKYIVSEVTFKNGVKEGLKKTFYQSGKVRQTFWYENDLREDSSRWYYEEGQLFRSSPYKRDTIDGTQIQYYRNGRIKAKLKYQKGIRVPYLEEFTQEGKLVGGYPDLTITFRDTYPANGHYRISLELSNKSTKVKYYRGDFSQGVFDTSKCVIIKEVDGKGTLDLKKTGSPKSNYVGIIAEILTNYGNKFLLYRKVDLPYNDLN